MAIKFLCHNCNNEVTAPDAAAGKKGKCPFCGHSNDIPAPLPPEELIPLAPVDEEAERQRAEEVARLREQERELLGELGGEEPVPLEHREDLTSADLHHFVVNYCLDMSQGKLQRAEQHAEKLRQHKPLGAAAVEDFLTGSAVEPALDHIPRPVILAFLKKLKESVART